MQGQSGPGFSWLVFSKEKGGSMEPKSATPNYTLADEDTKMVDELRNWIASDSGNIPDETLFSISDIVPQMYFNIYCQVVSTCSVEENVCYILRVWDGTKSIQ
ncbi:hypothetical protein FSP39_022504 [Pinctada imbricata]|uniref:Protection of telomeres protein 1 ssDNA-binding domain-containing protein n=1 Tax=Pinctada imbricata TaxID=66713 RepID=A0AA89C8I5_PINIB|nr:hypothetical protein FSP39_022504 [Pinctada imbricata]